MHVDTHRSRKSPPRCCTFHNYRAASPHSPQPVTTILEREVTAIWLSNSTIVLRIIYMGIKVGKRPISKTERDLQDVQRVLSQFLRLLNELSDLSAQNEGFETNLKAFSVFGSGDTASSLSQGRKSSWGSVYTKHRWGCLASKEARAGSYYQKNGRRKSEIHTVQLVIGN